MKTFAFLIIFMFLTATTIFAQTPPIEAGVSQALAKWRGANYSDVRYKLNITLEKGAPLMKGTIEIRVNAKAGDLDPLNASRYQSSPLQPHIILDWRKIKGKEDLSTVSNIEVNGRVAKFEEINEHLFFKDGVKIGENVHCR